MNQIVSEEKLPKQASPTVFKSRRERRAGEPKQQRTNVVEKAYTNNRAQTKARKNNKLYLKLAEYEMSVMGKRLAANRK